MFRNTLPQNFGNLGCLAGFIVMIIAILIAFGVIRGWEQPGSPSPTPVAASSPSGVGSPSPTATAPSTSGPSVTASPTDLPTAVAPGGDAACPLAAAAIQRRIDEPAGDERESVERNIELYREISDVTTGAISDDFMTMADLQEEYLELIAPFDYDFQKFLAAGDTAAFGDLVARQREPQQRVGAFLLQTCGIEFFSTATPE